MITAPPWLADMHLIGALGALVFYTAAWFYLGISAARKELKTTVRAAGFILLAMSSAVYGIDALADGTTLTAAILAIVGLAAVIISYVIQRAELQPRIQANAPTKQQQGKIASIVRGPAPNAARTTSPAQPKASAPPPAADREAITSTSRRAVKAKTGLRSAPLVRPPMQRKKARSVITAIAGLLVFIVVGSVSYAIGRKFLSAPADINPAVVEPQSSPQETAPSPTPADENADDESAAEPDTTSPTITVTETETGSLNVRDGASTATDIIGSIKPGDIYQLLGENETGTWFKIQVDANTAGWIRSTYADKNDE